MLQGFHLETLKKNPAGPTYNHLSQAILYGKIVAFQKDLSFFLLWKCLQIFETTNTSMNSETWYQYWLTFKITNQNCLEYLVYFIYVIFFNLRAANLWEESNSRGVHFPIRTLLEVWLTIIIRIKIKFL